jgi:hypothetical protein
MTCSWKKGFSTSAVLGLCAWKRCMYLDSMACLLGLEVASNHENMALWQALVVQLWTNFKNLITHHRTNYWAFFVIDDGSKVNPFSAQMMCCIVCYYDDNIPIQNNTRGYARMISCDKDHGTNSIKKHVNS